MTRTVLVLALVAAATLRLDAQEGSTQLSLEDAISIAVQQSRTLDSAALEIQKAETDVKTARTHRYPSFSFTASASQLLRPVDIVFPAGSFGAPQETTIRTDARLGAMVNAQIAQPLSQLGRINLNVKINEAGRDIQSESARAARISLVNNVRQVYYSILQLGASLDSTNLLIASLHEVNRTMQARLVQQVVLRGDVIDVESRLAQAELSRLSTQNDLATQKERLNQLMGRDVTTPFQARPVASAVPFEGDLDLIVTQSVARRPDVAQARLRIQQAELAKKVARSEHIPDVSLAFSYYSPVSVEGAPKNITTLGIQLDWEPFDWGRKSQAVTARSLELQQARHALRDAEDRAAIEIRSTHRKMTEAGAALRVARIAQEGARERARVRNAQFQVDASLVSDILQAQSALVSANTDYEHALLAYWKASADFEHALGQD